MILYFPVSALVTLFGNIIQNPMDPRARSDSRLMNLVVTFLSMLGQEAESGGVHRMLGVCSEFERIAKLVIDKAEKENAGRRKRKSHDPNTAAKPAGTPAAGAKPATTQTPRPSSASTPKPHVQNATPGGTVNGQLSPPLQQQDARSVKSGFSPLASTMSQQSSPAMAPTSWQVSSDFASAMNGGGGGPPDFASQFGDMNGFASGLAGGLHSPAMQNGMFGQPMLPQDLFSLPMTLDWDWAEMSGGAYPSIENGAQPR